MSDDDRGKQRVVDAKCLFLALRFSMEMPPDFEMRIRAIVELRSYSKSTARFGTEVFRRNLYYVRQIVAIAVR